MVEEKRYVDCIDSDDKVVQLPIDSELYYTENGKNYTIRYDFKKVFGNLENYMMKGYEALDVNEFDIEQLKNDDYEGTFVLKVVLNDSTILKHYYSFIGYEKENVMKVVPVKIPKTHRYKVDPTDIVSYNWYYIESDDDTEYVES